MKKSFIFMLVLCSGLAFADAPQVANSIDKTVESVAPAFTNPYKDVGNIPRPSLTNHHLFPQRSWFTMTKNANQCLGLPLSGCCSNNGCTSRT